MPAKASPEKRILLHRLDREVVDPLNIISALNESGKLGKGDSSFIIVVLNQRCTGVAM